MRQLLAGVVVLLAATLVLTACGSTSQEGSGSQTNSKELHLSRVKNYNTLSELRADSAAVVRVTAQEATAGDVHGVPVTVTQMRIDQVMDGQLPGRTIAVQQFGGPGVVSPDSAPLLVAGRQYLLFVTPLDPQHPASGRFAITGDQGVYELRGGSFALTAQAPWLPQRLAAAVSSGAWQ